MIPFTHSFQLIIKIIVQTNDMMNELNEELAT